MDTDGEPESLKRKNIIQKLIQSVISQYCQSQAFMPVDEIRAAVSCACVHYVIPSTSLTTTCLVSTRGVRCEICITFMDM